MSLIFKPGNAQKQPRDPRLQNKQILAWLHLLKNCAEKPSRRRVHAVRVATLRLLATVEAALAELSDRPDEAATVRRWIKQATRLRSALSAIREIDVNRSSLARVRLTFNNPACARVHTAQALQRKADRLDDHLKRRRKRAEKRFAAHIAMHGARLRDLTDALGCALSEWSATTHSRSINALTLQLAKEYTEFTPENMHAFRKRLRKVRYLAEASDASDRSTWRVVRMLRKLQIAIGAWHDWDALAGEARKARRGAAAKDSLTALLEELASESLTKAVHSCELSMEELRTLLAGKETRGCNAEKRRVQPVVVSRAMGALRRA